MALNVVRFLSLLLVGITMAAGLAHVMELPHKIGMPAAEYLVVQQIYRGWSLVVGIPMIGGLLATLALAATTRRTKRLFVPALVAFLCMAAALAVFFAFTWPANQATTNWTMLPENWEQLRAQWEYSHAVGAGFVLAAFVALIAAALARE